MAAGVLIITSAFQPAEKEAEGNKLRLSLKVLPRICTNHSHLHSSGYTIFTGPNIAARKARKYNFCYK